MFDFLVVGAGLFGATCARLLAEAGATVQVIEKRGHIAGNCYDEQADVGAGDAPLLVHRYGGHIFHTNSVRIWNFVRRFSSIKPYEHRVKAKAGQKVYSFPVNLMTLQQIYGVRDPDEARQILPNGKLDARLYEMFFEGYSRKQWGGNPPKGAIERIPVRMTWDDRYYADLYQGMPEDGYTAMVGRMLEGIPVQLETDYLEERAYWDGKASQIVYSGSIDALFGYDEGHLPYRSLRWHNETYGSDVQGCATVNYCDYDVPFTRILEWQHYGHRSRTGKTIITYEYPEAFEAGKNERIYPVNHPENRRMYERYEKRIPAGMWVGGRLGSYQYLNMDQAIGQAMMMVERITSTAPSHPIQYPLEVGEG
jgi:UDP-galactopyranose mutase